MNYLELAQKLRRKCRVAGSGPSAITGQNEEYNRLLDWINESWLELQNMRQDWQFMRGSAWCPTINGQSSYNATTDFGLTDFGQWALDYENEDTFRNYSNPAPTISIASPGVLSLTAHGLPAGQRVKLTTDGALPTGFTAGTSYYVVSPTTDTLQLAATVGGTPINTSGTQSGTHYLSAGYSAFSGFRSEVPMGLRDYDSWRDGWLFGAQRTTYTRPMIIAKAPDNNIVTGPIAAVGYTLVGDYYRIPSEMVASTDTPTLPSQFHWAIIYLAMMKYGASEAAPEVYDDGQLSFSNLLRTIIRTQARRPRLAGALA